MDSEFLTVEDVARVAHVTVRTVNRWCRQGRLPAARVGRKWLIRPELLDALFPPLPEGDNDNAKKTAQ